MNIHDAINARALVADFAKIGRKEFVSRFRKLKIGYTYDFEHSFLMSGRATSDSLVVEIYYNYYADFTHLGVGNGVSKEDRNIQKLVGGGRKAKKWKKGLAHTNHRLAEIYQTELANGITETISGSLQKKIVFNL